MASHSVDDLGDGRFKVRWREWVQEEGGERRRVGRSLTVTGKEAAVALHAAVARALDTLGYYETYARWVPSVGNLEEVAADWLSHKAARGCASSTLISYTSSVKRIFGALRAVEGLAESDCVPTTALTRDAVTKVTLDLQRAGLSDSTVYTTTRVIYDVWKWGADEPDKYPGLAAPPLDPTRVVSRAPIYVAPPAPTLAELDACLRHLPERMAYVARPAGIVMRFTGLRVGQVYALKCEDLDMTRAELVVTTGKTRREKAERRTVPVSRHLVEELREWVSSQPPSAPLVRRRKDLRAPDGMNHLPGGALAKGWERATAAGEARRAVWQPPNRKLSRPDHAFRAGFQSHLESVAVRDSVIDFLVGHQPSTVRGRHYAPASAEQLRAAVDLLAPIDWVGVEEALPGNVVALRRR